MRRETLIHIWKWQGAREVTFMENIWLIMRFLGKQEEAVCWGALAFVFVTARKGGIEKFSDSKLFSRISA
jgi:hypothetical protein